MKITDPMWRALEKMHRGEPSILHPTGEHEYYVTHSTAYALDRRGLATFDGMATRTGGTAMPEYRMNLTELGKTYCHRRFDKAET